MITTDLRGRPTTISGITASVGVATTHHAEGSVDDLLVKADSFLYQAKELGRNRVCGPALAAASAGPAPVLGLQTPAGFAVFAGAVAAIAAIDWVRAGVILAAAVVTAELVRRIHTLRRNDS